MRERSRDVWIVFTGRQSLRTFLATGIYDMLRRSLGPRLVPVMLFSDENAAAWLPAVGTGAILRSEIRPESSTRWERFASSLDRRLERQLGFYPLAIRLNLRYGFHRERMRPGHEIGWLNPAFVGRLPRWTWIERAMKRWYFSGHRYVPRALLHRMRGECGVLVLANLQSARNRPFLTSATRLGIPTVGYLASWDNAVGKGVVPAHLSRYVVQNEAMRQDLERYHGISGGRVAVTGWPQSDVYATTRPIAAFHELIRRYGLDPALPVVMFAANWPLHAPYEGTFVRRLVEWWDDGGVGTRASLLVRPHPTDLQWRERFASGVRHSGVHVEDSSYADFESLVTLLQHVACVIVNGGTIMLDAIVNGRPTICIAYDEGAPSGQRWAYKNLLGEHYRVLMGSNAFYLAERFEDVVTGLERALADPGEFASERARVAREVVGELDGRAAERVVDAIVRTVP